MFHFSRSGQTTDQLAYSFTYLFLEAGVHVAGGKGWIVVRAAQKTVNSFKKKPHLLCAGASGRPGRLASLLPPLHLTIIRPQAVDLAPYLFY